MIATMLTCSISGTGLVVTLCVLGSVFQFFGVGLTALQLRWARIKFADPDTTPGFARWMTRWLSHSWAKVRAFVLYEILRRPGESVVSQAASASGFSGVGNPTVKISTGPLVRTNPTQDQLNQLDDRLTETIADLADVLKEVREKHQQVNNQIGGVETRTNERFTESDERLALYATGGLRLSAISVLLIMAGTVLLAASAIVAAN
jgi:hypothetical protein